MTHRTEERPPDPIERATQDVCASLRLSIREMHRNHQLQIPLAAFARIIALFLTAKSDDEMLELLGGAPDNPRNGYQ